MNWEKTISGIRSNKFKSTEALFRNRKKFGVTERVQRNRTIAQHKFIEAGEVQIDRKQYGPLEGIGIQL